jgi:hypothetical protein
MQGLELQARVSIEFVPKAVKGRREKERQTSLLPSIQFPSLALVDSSKCWEESGEEEEEDEEEVVVASRPLIDKASWHVAGRGTA